ncbi:MAG: ribonuclease H-like domain-containing protein [Lachnospiraceae bacterium]|nr:ribonuclease H-like domain-containing protein [Lachnospiraceae bacterium]
MKTINKTIYELNIPYSIEHINPLSKTVFIDIETTGFTAKTSSLYLIGCITYDNNQFIMHQWFAQTPEDEENVLRSFVEFIKDYNFLIHYNGNHFDIPYLEQKLNQYNISFNLSALPGLDIYKRIAPYRDFLKLPNCKQKTVETYLGIMRDDVLTGGDLIGVYHNYVKNPIDEYSDLLLLHNEEDVKGMVKLLPILSYVDLFNEPLTVVKVYAQSYTDQDGNPAQEIVMKAKIKNALPVQISNYANHCFFTAFGENATIKVPLFEGELKYFYSNYKEYFYLPMEDVALHKSVAIYVDKEHREKATAANCYTKKYSTYLPQWDYIVEPFFKAEYKSKELFWEVTEENKKNRQLFSSYASHILQMIMKH